MTRQEFNKSKWGAGMKAAINGSVRDIVSVDFEQKLIGLEIEGDDENIDWVRCENVELIDPQRTYLEQNGPKV